MMSGRLRLHSSIENKKAPDSRCLARSNFVIWRRSKAKASAIHPIPAKKKLPGWGAKYLRLRFSDLFEVG
jgi:hypothetical protein